MFNLTQLNMKQLDKIRYLWQGLLSLLGILLIFNSCEVDDFTVTPPTGDANPAPTLSLTGPGDTVSFQIPFTISAELSDNSPGLSVFGYSIIDSTGALVITEQRFLYGTTSTTVEFEVDSAIAIARYTLDFFVEDTQGKRVEDSQMLDVIGTQSVLDEVFLIGDFTGWGDSGDPNFRDLPMDLIDDFTWQSSDSIYLTPSSEFKFVDAATFGGNDWGEESGQCDGVAFDGAGETNINAGGACSIVEGYHRITFNDQTLAYSIERLTANQAEMFILGNFNGWGGTDNAMHLVDNNTWKDTDITLPADAAFKFVNTSNFGNGDEGDWGDSECDGVAALLNDDGGGDIICEFDGTFTVTFNDETLEYSVEPQ